MLVKDDPSISSETKSQETEVWIHMQRCFLHAGEYEAYKSGMVPLSSIDSYHICTRVVEIRICPLFWYLNDFLILEHGQEFYSFWTLT